MPLVCWTPVATDGNSNHLASKQVQTSEVLTPLEVAPEAWTNASRILPIQFSINLEARTVNHELTLLYAPEGPATAVQLVHAWQCLGAIAQASSRPHTSVIRTMSVVHARYSTSRLLYLAVKQEKHYPLAHTKVTSETSELALRDRHGPGETNRHSLQWNPPTRHRHV